MTIIRISEISPAGSELFQDAESFLNELTDEEMDILGGKGRHYKVHTVVTIYSNNIRITPLAAQINAVRLYHTANADRLNTYNANTVGNYNSVM